MKPAMRAWVAAALGLLLTTVAQSADLSRVLAPDTILHHGKIVTVDAKFSIAEAVAIKNGRFIAVGSNDEILALAGEKTEKVDLEGRTVLPGFNDAHVHLAQRVGEAPDPLNGRMARAKSIAEIVEIVRLKVAATPAGKPVWFPEGPSRVEQLQEKRWPNRKDLDPVSPAHPVILAFASDYVNITNSAGLAGARITRRTPQPSASGLFGGIEVDRATGEPTGVMTGMAASRMLREVSTQNIWPVEKLEANIERALRDDITPKGLTSLSDPLTSNTNVTSQLAYQRLAGRKDGLLARINLMIRIPIRSGTTDEILGLIQGLMVAPPLRTDYLRVGTFKMSLDKDVPGGEPYIVPAEKARTVMLEAHKKGWQLYLHITTPQTFDYACAILEEAQRLYPRQDARHVFTHVNMPTAENIAIMKRLGIVADLQVSSIYNMVDDAERNRKVNSKRPDFGPKPVATYRDAGIPILLSTDQAPIGPMFTIWEAVNRVRRSGRVFQPEERLTVQEAIRASTLTPAWAFFEDDVKGSVEPGKYADLVVLGRDILTIDPLEIKDVPVLMTMTGGKFVYVNPNKDPRQKVDYLRYPARTSYLN